MAGSKPAIQPLPMVTVVPMPISMATMVVMAPAPRPMLMMIEVMMVAGTLPMTAMTVMIVLHRSRALSGKIGAAGLHQFHRHRSGGSRRSGQGLSHRQGNNRRRSNDGKSQEVAHRLSFLLEADANRPDASHPVNRAVFTPFQILESTRGSATDVGHARASWLNGN
ncbi:MAG: hypothetical protein BGP04_06040 [Rhizobiales bacterium 62-17]|nr:MAG: hypothetical protein BGP04_06040 [Rhizobiales bacterium 62-17]